MPAGRPRKYQHPQDMQDAIDSFFALNPVYPTMTGLALHLGFCDRRSLYDLQEYEEEFSYITRAAISRIEAIHEQRLFGDKPQGSIFWLKNRGWTEQIDVTSKGESIKPQTLVVANGNLSSALAAMVDAGAVKVNVN
jgi:hypothetical protein